jgi:sugar transferase (PEP-CTERM/EpsH1 system associated)
VKILWVKSGGFLPLDTGGKIRSYSLLRELSRRHEVSVFTFYPEQQGDRHGELHDFCKEVFLQPLVLPPRASFSDMLAYARNIPRPVPYPMVKYCRPEVKTRLGRLLASQRYDAILCDFLLTAAVIPWEISYPKVIFTHNVEAVIWERHWRVSRNPLWKLMSWREYRTMARVERLYLSKADHVLTVSDTDREFFSQTVAPEKITTIPTGVDVDYFQGCSTTNSEESDTLVFSGSMDWLPNEDAMLYFADNILPLIRERVPGVKLIVVGRQPTQPVRALAARHPNIEVTGTVADIRPYLKKACVYVVPLRIGGGTRIKIFEAMAMGKAVVSTSIGAEGLPVASGKNIVIEDTPEAFAAAVLRLLGDAEERRDVGRAARELVERQYSWSAVTDVLESALLKIAQERGTELRTSEVLV